VPRETAPRRALRPSVLAKLAGRSSRGRWRCTTARASPPVAREQLARLLRSLSGVGAVSRPEACHDRDLLVLEDERDGGRRASSCARAARPVSASRARGVSPWLETTVSPARTTRPAPHAPPIDEHAAGCSRQQARAPARGRSARREHLVEAHPASARRDERDAVASLCSKASPSTGRRCSIVQARTVCVARGLTETPSRDSINERATRELERFVQHSRSEPDL